jgi:hypothetical protein
VDVESQVRRWSWRLKDLLRERRRTQRWVEQQLGWASGYMSHLLRPGPPALKVEHVLAILEMIDVPPRDFFVELYAVTPGAPGTVPLPSRPPRAAAEADAGGASTEEPRNLHRLVDSAVRDAERRLRLSQDELRELIGAVVREELERQPAAQQARRRGQPKAG